MKIEVSKLRSHPINDKIYENNMDIDDLLENIDRVGLLEPLVVVPSTKLGEYHVISGNRRLKCIRMLPQKYKYVNVNVLEVEKKEIPLMIVSYNRTRIKKPSCLLKEILILEKSYSIGKGKRTFQQKFANPGIKIKGDSRKIIGEKVGISSGQVSKLKYINSIQPTLFEKIDKGELTINQGYLICERIKNQIDAITPNNQKIRKTLETSNVKIFNQSSERLSQIKDGEIDAIITSVPFYLKRTYTNDKNELGRENTVDEYVQNLCNHFDECFRVLSKSGVMYFHISDSYNKNGSLLNVPHLVVIEMMKRKNWLQKNCIVVKKRNPLPNSVKNRLSTSYDFCFMMVKTKEYSFNHLRIDAKTNTKNVSAPFHRGDNKSVTPYISDGKKNIQDYFDEGEMDVIVTSVANQIVTKNRFGILHPCPYPSQLRQIFLSLILPKENNLFGKKKSTFKLLDPFMGLGELLLDAYENGISHVYGYDINSNFTKSCIKEFKKLGVRF